MLANGVQFYVLPNVKADWLDFSVTTWQKSKRFAGGRTIGTDAEMFIDKIAEFALKRYVERELIERLPELEKLDNELRSADSYRQRLNLQQKALEIISNVLYSIDGECCGIKIKISGRKVPRTFYCITHRCIKPIHERSVIDSILRMSSEITIHELMHALHNDISDSFLLVHNSVVPNEYQVTEMAKYLAHTQDLHDDELTQDETKV